MASSESTRKMVQQVESDAVVIASKRNLYYVSDTSGALCCVCTRRACILRKVGVSEGLDRGGEIATQRLNQRDRLGGDVGVW